MNKSLTEADAIRSGIGVPGRLNSSITRVRPVFQSLLLRDPSGQSWLPAILHLADDTSCAREMARIPGRIRAPTLRKRKYVDAVLRHHGIGQVQLEECFETPLPPPARFLRWLIQNPERMTWPENGQRRFGRQTQRLRENLFAANGVSARQEAQRLALSELAQHGSSGSKRKWWAFEGFTEIDCYLVTNTMILAIEGKRTEGLSPATDWYPRRSQLLRNLEVTQQAVGKSNFGVLLIAEQTIPNPSKDEIDLGLPHLSEDERWRLMSHFLGCVCWKDVCHAVDLDYNTLPDRVEEVAAAYMGVN